MARSGWHGESKRHAEAARKALRTRAYAKKHGYVNIGTKGKPMYVEG